MNNSAEPAEVVLEAWIRSGHHLADAAHRGVRLGLVNNCAYLILLFAQLEPRVQRHWDDRYGYEAGFRKKLETVMEDLGVPLPSRNLLLAGYEIRNDCAHGRTLMLDLDLGRYYRAMLEV